MNVRSSRLCRSSAYFRNVPISDIRTMAGAHLHDQDGPEIVDVRSGWTRDEQVVHGIERGPGVVSCEKVMRLETACRQSGDSRPIRECAGIVFGTVDSIGIGSQGEEAVPSGDLDCQCKKELRIPPALSIPPDR